MGTLGDFQQLCIMVYPILRRAGGLNLAKRVQKGGFDVRPILSPTVPQGSERLRISLHAFNTEMEVKELVNCLKKNT